MCGTHPASRSCDLTCGHAHRAKLEITHGHKHDHGDHVHDERTEIEQKAVDAEGDDAERSRLTKALVKVHPHSELHHLGFTKAIRLALM